MDIHNAEDQQYLQLAIQTALYNNRDRMNLLTDFEDCTSFIRELSQEVLKSARRFKQITIAVIDDMEHPAMKCTMMSKINDRHLVDGYLQALEQELDEDFIALLRKEIEKRRLLDQENDRYALIK